MDIHDNVLECYLYELGDSESKLDVKKKKFVLQRTL